MTLWLVRWFGADYRQAVAYTLVLVGVAWNVAGAVTLGLVAFLVIAALAAVAGIVIWLRVWWLKRRLEKEGFKPHEMQDPEPKGHVIDAEYTVVEEPRDPPDS